MIDGNPIAGSAAPFDRGHLPVDDDARALAARLMTAGEGALATSLDGRPLATRVACLMIAGTGMTLLVSGLSDHSRALDQDPECALMTALGGDRGDAGDPLTGPRLTLRGRAWRIDKAQVRDAWLQAHPAASLYYDFADFRVLRIEPSDALLIAGFGRAVRLAPEDLPR